MNRDFRHLCIAVFAFVLKGGNCYDAEAQLLQTPSFTEIVFIGLRPANELNCAHCPEEIQLCVRKYLATIAPDSNLWGFKVPSSPEKAVPVRKRSLIEQMVSILGREVLNDAGSSTNPLILCIAEDLEAQPFVYLEGQGRP